MNFIAALVFGLFLVGSSLAQKTAFTLDDFLTGRYASRGYGGVWISDDTIEERTADGIKLWNVTSNATVIAVAESILTGHVQSDSYTFSGSRNYILLRYDTQSQFRHSTTARFTVYDRFMIGSRNYTDVAGGNFLQTCQWLPNGSTLLYVENNDIYLFNVVSGTTTRLTESGVPGVIYNGVPDWVYEEEVLLGATAFWVSPDGKGLIYLQFDDTHVPEMTYLHYGSPGTVSDQYPQEVTIRYPKPGTRNPTHYSYFVNLTDYSLRPLSADLNGNSVSYGFAWGNNEEFVELTMNRVQNESKLVVYDAVLGTSELVSEKKVRNGWDRSSLPLFGESGAAFVTIDSVEVSGGRTYRQLVRYEAPRWSSHTYLTMNSFDVLSVVGWDEANNYIYYSATVENNPSHTQVYRVTANSNSNNVCITCGLTTSLGNPCTSASARFSKSYTRVTIYCTGPDPSLVAVYINEYPLGAPEYVVQDNAALIGALQTKLLPRRLDTQVEVAGGFQANVRLLLPPNFDTSLTYPLLINVYAGPDSNQISEGYSAGFEAYMTTNLSVVYGYIDGRGSGRNGDELVFAGYRNLGTVEILDQINVTRQLKERYSWIDRNRTAIWGWSYGGYATGRTLELDTDNVFQCGISVAPVTSWLYYDSIYTERYMALPTADDNLNGYQDGDLVSNVTNLKTKQYYLIHGNADDNVHYQQSMLLSRSLELNDVLFTQQSYPDENHSLGGVSRHLYHSMDKFWRNCFA